MLFVGLGYQGGASLAHEQEMHELSSRVQQGATNACELCGRIEPE
jgi:hypothetical protein